MSAPPWLVALREKRRTAVAGTVEPTAQSQARRGPGDMLLEQRSCPADDDPAEELTYGPGIVNKLKSRYISLTLREAPAKPRPSLHKLRRAASLEHGLDDDPDINRPVYRPKKDTVSRPNRYRPATRTPEAAKRARSVDALVRCDSRSSEDASPLRSPTPPSPPPPPSPEKTLRPKRPSPLLKETERPPPDLVKTTLKIFESNPIKRTKPPAHTGQVADKVKSFAVHQIKPKPRICANKPAVPPRSPALLSPEARTFPVSTQTTPSLAYRPPPSPKKIPLLLIENEEKLTNGDTPPPETNGKPRTSTPDPESKDALLPSEISVICTEPTRKLSTSSEDGSYDFGEELPATKIIDSVALNNISKASTTAQFSFNGTNGDSKKSHLPITKPKPMLEDDSSEDEENIPEIVKAKNPRIEETFREAKLLSPLTPLLIPRYSMPIPSEIVPCKKPDFIKTPVSPPRVKAPSPSIDDESSPALILRESATNGSPLTSREIEKNLINKTKSLEQPLKKVTVTVIDAVVPKVSEVESAVVRTKEISIDAVPESNGIDAGASPGSLKPSPKRPHWQQQQHQQQNTMVFNFSDRKEVPDYIENDGIILRSSKRDRPKVADTISLRGLSGESADFQDDPDGGDWAIWAAGPPSPCDVVFENDNVVINGRSNIAKPNSKPKKLKIQFDDTLTKTFEYPSESSLTEDIGTVQSSNSISSLALGGSLSTYTPSKVSLQADTFELGVTKTVVAVTTNGQKMDVEESTATNGDVESHNWSHETHIGAGDLLF